MGRDTRITTHVCLTSRAFGASKIYLSGEEDHKLMENVRDTADRWGGNFEIEYAKNYMGVINKWKDNGGKVVHLTMYGSQAHEIVGEVQESGADILIVVGGAKVPGKVYKSADWNVSVTTQPHSEVSSLAVFQHLLMDGKEFDLEFENPVFEVIPTAHGKNVNIHDENRQFILEYFLGLKKYLNSIISNFNWMGENIIVYLMGIVFSIIRDNILLNNSDVKLINDTS